MINIDLGLVKSFDEMEQDAAVYEYALLYVKNGFKILPQKKDGKGYIKHLSIDHATDSPEVVKHWFGPGGPYEGYNILGVCPPGIMVLDFDKHGKANGFEASGLEMHDLSGLRVLTPGGGCHFYTSDKITFFKKTLGIDKKTAILLPPSLANGIRYQWDTGGEPGSLPEKMLEALGGQKAKKKEIEEFASVAPEEFIKELLTYFDPGCDYTEWCNVGMALHDNDPGQGHLDIWTEWSQGSDKFKPGECERRWETFSLERTRKVTLAWMIYTAKQRGREPKASDAKFSGINIDAYEAVQRMNQRFMATNQGGNAIISINKDHKGHAYYTRTTPGDFKGLVASNLQPILIGDRYVPAAEYWLKSKYRRDGIMVMEYPGQEREGDINLYSGFVIKPVPCEPTDIQFFLDHTLNVICRGNQAHCDYLLDMIAAKLQKPLDLLGTALVLKGKEGSGKSSFGEFMRLIIGPVHATKVSTREALLGAYSGGISDKLFVIGEEAVFSAHKGEAERLKAMVTETPLDWNNKFVKQWSQRNCLFLMFTTNENWAIPAGFDSRRFFVLLVSDDKVKDMEYWRQFNSLCGANRSTGEPNNPEYLGRLLHFFLSRKITNDVSVALETEELQEQRVLTNQDSVEAAFVNWVSRTFLDAKGDDSIIEGAGKEASFAIVTYKKEPWLESRNMYYDFRAFYMRHHAKGRGCCTEREFKRRLSQLGFTVIRVKKGLLKVGAGKYPGEPENKIRIARMVAPNIIEEKLIQHYPLFMDADDEEADDSTD